MQHRRDRSQKQYDEPSADPGAVSEQNRQAARKRDHSREWHRKRALSNNGPLRFGVLRRQVEGISSRVLTERLRTLEENQFVFRHYQAVIPLPVTYGITDRMKDIEKVLAQLEDLSRKWKTEGREGPQASRTGSSSIALNPHTGSS